LRRCAALVGAPQDGWLQDADGVPMPQDGLSWSISHKRTWAAAVIADRPVGIDVEKIEPRRVELLDELGDADEWRRMGDRSWHSFFRLWTAKEAALKANGVGIGRLAACRLVDVASERQMALEYEGRSWLIEHFGFEGHLAAVTYYDAEVDWLVWDPGA
jgi:4'-phosphopantetheinyl transferase